jgi:hypothetical protein
LNTIPTVFDRVLSNTQRLLINISFAESCTSSASTITWCFIKPALGGDDIVDQNDDAALLCFLSLPWLWRRWSTQIDLTYQHYVFYNNLTSEQDV